MKIANARLLVGRKIVGFELQGARDKSRGVMLYAPVITLDNGARVSFTVQEGEDDYGIDPTYWPKKKARVKL
jgi:hypothetical protein